MFFLRPYLATSGLALAALICAHQPSGVSANAPDTTFVTLRVAAASEARSLPPGIELVLETDLVETVSVSSEVIDSNADVVLKSRTTGADVSSGRPGARRHARRFSTMQQARAGQSLALNTPHRTALARGVYAEKIEIETYVSSLPHAFVTVSFRFFEITNSGRRAISEQEYSSLAIQLHPAKTPDGRLNAHGAVVSLPANVELPAGSAVQLPTSELAQSSAAKTSNSEAGEP